MKRYRTAALFLALLAALASCGARTGPDLSGSASAPPDVSQTQSPPQKAAPFTLAIYPGYSIHPVLAANRANLTLAPLLYEPLFQVDAGFQAVPVLCQDYTLSEDKLTWTFTLRPGVTFSDGTPLTGAAAAAALNTARGEHSRYAGRLEAVSAVSGDEGSVTVTLSRPESGLPLLLDIPIALGTGDRPLGTGPYVLREGEAGLSLTAREDWWQGKPLPEQTILLQSVSRSDESILAFDSGDVTLVDVDLMGTNSLGYSGSYESWDYPTTDLLYLGFNTREGLCRTAGVRQALALAIDRETIAQIIYASHAVPSTLPVHPASPLHQVSLDGALAYNPEELVSRLEERKVLGRELVFLVNSENPAKVSAAQLIAYQLEAAGMEVTLTQLVFEEYTAALERGEFDLFLGEVVLTAAFDLSPLLTPEGALNYGGWEDWDACGLLEALGSAETRERTRAAGELLAYLSEQVPIAPIVFKNGSVLTQWGRLSGLTPVRGNVFYQMENWTVQ